MTYRMAPGSTVTSAAAISFEIWKLDESDTLTLPPGYFVAGTFENGNVYGRLAVPCGLTGASLSGRGSAWKRCYSETARCRSRENEDRPAGKM